MPNRTWTVKLDGVRHTITLYHGFFTGTRRIMVDGEVLVDTRKFADFGSLHHFMAGQTPCEIGILTNGLRYDYYLVAGDSLVKPENAQLSAMVKRFETELTFWKELARLTGLRPALDPDNLSASLMNLYGEINGYQVMVARRLISPSLRPVLTVFVRHAPVADPAAAARDFTGDAELTQLLGKSLRQKGVISMGAEAKLVNLQLDPKKENPKAAAEKVRTVVRAAGRVAGRRGKPRCQNSHCKNPDSDSLQLILLNGLPYTLCADCLAALPAETEQAQREYQKSSRRLGTGLLIGLGVTLATALLMAGLYLAVRVDLLFLVPFTAFVLTLLLAGRAGVRSSALMLLLSALLSMGGMIFSVYLLYLDQLVSQAGRPFSAAVLSQAWVSLGSGGEISRLLVPGGIYLLLMLIFTFFQQRSQVRKHFQPEVSVIGPVEKDRSA